MKPDEVQGTEGEEQHFTRTKKIQNCIWVSRKCAIIARKDENKMTNDKGERGGGPPPRQVGSDLAAW